jgi:putative hydrolase of the HAD superfamily
MLRSEVKYEAVIFDLFHTLVSLTASGDPGPRPFEVVGVPEDEWFAAWRRHEERRVRGQCGSVAEVVADVIRDLGLEPLPELCARVCATRRHRFRHGLVNVVAEVLNGLRRLRPRVAKLGLMSDADFDEIASWQESPLAPLFDVALFSCYEGVAKPNPAFYHLAAQHLGVDPTRCIYAGDGARDEHVGARRVGMSPVLVTWSLESSAPERIPALAQPCDAVVRYPGDVIGLLMGQD